MFSLVPRRVRIISAVIVFLISALPGQVAAREAGAATPVVADVRGATHAFDPTRDPRPLLEAHRAGYQTVFPPDERVRVSRTDTFPASAVALVVAGNSEWDAAACTGTLIGPQVMLTAAHCLYHPDWGGWPDIIGAVPGKNGEAEPFGIIPASDAWVPAGWISGYDEAWDWGLIKLPTSIGDETGWFTIGVLTTQALSDPNFSPTVSGYPGDKPFGTQWASTKPAFLSVEPFTLNTDLDLAPGQSGSAVRRASDGLIVGIVVRQYPDHNEASRIDAQLLEYLQQGCEVMRCSFDAYVEPSPAPQPPASAPPPSTGVPAPGPAPIGHDAFLRTWSRTDQPVAASHAGRTWMWGPQGYTPIFAEPYAEAPGGQRMVQYFDKSRMEITNPNGDPSSIWYVTNGLLVLELMTGLVQTGDASFENRTPAQVNVAGDPDDPFGPTYAALGPLRGFAPTPLGWRITQTVDHNGHVGNREDLGGYGVTAAVPVPETNHTVASVFWDFMNSSGLVVENGSEVQGHLFQNPFYATGFPVTEPYWAQVKVGGVVKDVLLQCFERRCLTYTPSNPPGWQVEAGNVGQHYYRWRYGM